MNKHAALKEKKNKTIKKQTKEIASPKKIPDLMEFPSQWAEANREIYVR